MLWFPMYSLYQLASGGCRNECRCGRGKGHWRIGERAGERAVEPESVLVYAPVHALARYLGSPVDAWLWKGVAIEDAVKAP